MEGYRAPMPGDSQWKSVSSNPAAIQEYGRFAVEVQNKSHGLDMKFNVVYASWNMILASDFGKLYLILIKALNVDLEDYEAIVWVRSQHPDCDPKTLISFKQLPPSE